MGDKDGDRFGKEDCPGRETEMRSIQTRYEKRKKGRD